MPSYLDPHTDKMQVATYLVRNRRDRLVPHKQGRIQPTQEESYTANHDHTSRSSTHTTCGSLWEGHMIREEVM